MSPCSSVTASTNDSIDNTDDTIDEGSPSRGNDQGRKKTGFARAEKAKEDRKRKREKDKVTETISESIADLGAILKKKVTSSIINAALKVTDNAEERASLKAKLIALALDMSF